jgi:predicted MFS family arabinose efflux permease
LLLVNIWQLPVALAPNFGSIMAVRFLGGLSSAGGSVTLGMVADMWDADNQKYAVAYVVISSVGGSVLKVQHRPARPKYYTLPSIFT